jgi:hypothetical protein
MRFYKEQHQFYTGIDLHARTMYQAQEAFQTGIGSPISATNISFLSYSDMHYI